MTPRSVVAAGYAYGGDAGPASIIVKLTRTLMLVPIVIGLALIKTRNGVSVSAMPWRKIVPAFLIGFLHPVLSAVGGFLITTALAGIGLSLRPAELRKAGHRPLLLGALLWVAVAASSLGLQTLTGTI